MGSLLRLLGALGVSALALGIFLGPVNASDRDQARTSTFGGVLHDQYDNPGEIATNSQNWDFDLLDTELADDFVVPAAQWNISGVDVDGIYLDTRSATSVNVRFYSNSTADLPDTLLDERLEQAMADTDGDLVIDLSPPLTLQAGTYWVSVQVNQNLGDGQWGWVDRTVQSNAGAAFRSPIGGGGGCFEWGRRHDPDGCNVDPEAPDQVFRLRGTVGPPSCRLRLHRRLHPATTAAAATSTATTAATAAASSATAASASATSSAAAAAGALPRAERARAHAWPGTEAAPNPPLQRGHGAPGARAQEPARPGGQAAPAGGRGPGARLPRQRLARPALRRSRATGPGLAQSAAHFPRRKAHQARNDGSIVPPIPRSGLTTTTSRFFKQLAVGRQRSPDARQATGTGENSILLFFQSTDKYRSISQSVSWTR